MIHLIILHIKYHFSKYNIISFICLLIGTFILSLSTSKWTLSYNEQMLYASTIKANSDYLMMAVLKLIIILISSYIFSSFKSNTLILLIKTNKLKFYVSKHISNILIITLVSFGIYFVYNVVGLIFTKWYYFDLWILKEYILLIIKSIIVGLICECLSYILKGRFIFILVYFIYLVLENLISDNILFQVINTFFPVLINKQVGIIQLLLLYYLYNILGFCTFNRYENY